MRNIETIANDLASFEFGQNADRRLYQLAEEIELHSQGQRLLKYIFELFENHPEGDFGMPGPLAHVAEKFYGDGYEDELECSLLRHPTKLTIWLANRIVNARDVNYGRFKNLLLNISENKNLSEDIKAEATDFLKLHGN